jgi:Holliday junction resolvasome RuvABC endonuclease subunit
MRILGIDPGYERLGVAVLEKNQSDKKERVLFSECFKTSARLEFPERLRLIGEEVTRII